MLKKIQEKLKCFIGQMIADNSPDKQKQFYTYFASNFFLYPIYVLAFLVSVCIVYLFRLQQSETWVIFVVFFLPSVLVHQLIHHQREKWHFSKYMNHILFGAYIILLWYLILQ